MSAPAGAKARVVRGTVVFTDIVGFTEYTALRGDEEALALLARQERIVRDALPSGARIVKELGDGLLLWFADACQALETSLRLQQRFEEESNKGDVPLWVRCGMHSGQQTRRGSDLVGHAVNVAARVVDVAGPGEVLLSDATLAEVGGEANGISFEELGPVVMKGLPQPVRLYRAAAG
jgi:class 3 adenylate cyclase